MRLIKLEHREFRIVLRGDAFVPEVRLISCTFDTAHCQSLQVKLRRDSKVQPHVECVVVRHEGSREGAAGNRLHHRRLDFEIPARVEKGPHCGQDPAPHLEDLARVRVDYQIEVRWRYRVSMSLSPCHFSEGEALCEELQPGGADCQLIRLGPERLPSTPTKSPKSRSRKISKSRSGSESCRMYT